MDCSLPGSSVHGISQARILEWVAISFSSGSSWPRGWMHVSCIGRWVLYHWATREALKNIFSLKKGRWSDNKQKKVSWSSLLHCIYKVTVIIEEVGRNWGAAAAKLFQSCLTLCDPIDGSPPGPSVPGILQARTGVGCHFLLQCMKVKSESEFAQLCPTLSDPMDCSLAGSSVHGIFQARES